MKPLILGALIIFTSCTKTVLTEKPVTVDQFRTLVTGNTFSVTAYSGTIPYPESTDDNVYWFTDSIGTIDSKEPCIQYNAPLRIYAEGNDVKMDWVNLSVEYATYRIKEVGINYFVLEGNEHTITYTVKSR
jgi:hypothetical protein